MFDFGTAVGYVYLRAVLAPIWGIFRGVRETALQVGRGRFVSMILMQDKARGRQAAPSQITSDGRADR